MGFDELLRDALLGAACADAAGAESPLPPPSPGYRRFRRRVLRDPFGYARRAAWSGWRRALRAAAMVALALTLAASLSLLSPTVRAAARELVQRWFQTDYADHLEITFPGVEPAEGPVGVWRPTWLPEGYTETETLNDENHGWIEYVNSDGQWISFSYHLMDEGTIISLNNENVSYTEIKIMGCRGFLQESTKESIPSGATWFDEERGIVFDVAGYIGGEELSDIANSVQKVE